jgi:hypothetical protein
MEGGWRIEGSETLGLKPDADGNIDIPPLIDNQLSFVILTKILKPLRKKVLEGLLRLFKTKKRSDWVVVFLASYMLLHNYEMIMKAQIEIARWRQAEVRIVPNKFFEGFFTHNS